MSEHEPLLPVWDSEHASERYKRIHARTAKFLDSQITHRTVITLVAIDTTFVVIDLGYTFLSANCTIPSHESPQWLEVFSYLSLAITGLFLIEIPLNVWAFGLQFINPFGPIPHAWLHAFDAAIIITTFVLEVVLRGKERELASLLVILRLWRLVKVVGGVAVGAGELEEENAKLLAETRAELETTRKDLKDAKDEINFLRNRIDEVTASAHEPDH
ncbi:hypothetical protein BDQ12DRAFT_676623 [Crucibulum laeve]|uniref:Voltage-gated hydrogen channel 1 n=1 Tax=Crucibulum laeve TaxID=68775 RepID=A0A5C3MD53_9AGAR|nr:hypothetical protein BDQ12DRAFT_676623 [Crucibulum laeve]